jgi:uncharacterized Fe-S cluster-containing radical SAM superfamily protein
MTNRYHDHGRPPDRRPPASPPLAPGKFVDPRVTASGEPRARVDLERLDTLWINTGTLCNLACENCYIESTPRNDRLAYLSAEEVRAVLDDVSLSHPEARTIGFTGGEPFMNRALPDMLEDALGRGFEALVLTNAMKPMTRRRPRLLALKERYGRALTLRVSLDHYGADVHERERGPATFEPTLDGLCWLVRNGFSVAAAGRGLSGESEEDIRDGFARLFAQRGIALDAFDPSRLVVFPEMDERADVPEITEACWSILGKSPSEVMCATSRMVVKRKGAARPVVLACTLIAYDEAFELGPTLSEARGPVALNHPHCARFCVLGGASCTAG